MRACFAGAQFFFFAEGEGGGAFSMSRPRGPWFLNPSMALTHFMQGFSSHATVFGEKGGVREIEPFKMNSLSVFESFASEVQSAIRVSCSARSNSVSICYIAVHCRGQNCNYFILFIVFGQLSVGLRSRCFIKTSLSCHHRGPVY